VKTFDAPTAGVAGSVLVLVFAAAFIPAMRGEGRSDGNVARQIQAPSISGHDRPIPNMS
jgi:hypothetical protein